LYILDFPAFQNPFTTLHFTPLHFNYHISAPYYGNTSFIPHFEFPSLHFTSLHFTSLQLSYFTPFSWKYLIYSSPRISFTSLHFNYHISSPFHRNTSFTPHFEFPSLHFTSLHFTSIIIFQPLFMEILHLLLTSNSLHFTSHHFTSIITFQPIFMEIFNLPLTSKFLHFTSLITFLSLFLEVLG